MNLAIIFSVFMFSFFSLFFSGNKQLAQAKEVDFYQFSFKNQNIVELETEMNQFDRQIQGEFIESINKYLLYDDGLGYFFFDNRNPNVNSGFLKTGKFPIRILKNLKNVYWPFSTHW